MSEEGVYYCYYYQHGKCNQGDDCKFVHEYKEGVLPPLCKYFAEHGQCRNANKCQFLHMGEEGFDVRGETYWSKEQCNKREARNQERKKHKEQKVDEDGFVLQSRKPRKPRESRESRKHDENAFAFFADELGQALEDQGLSAGFHHKGGDVVVEPDPQVVIEIMRRMKKAGHGRDDRDFVRRVLLQNRDIFEKENGRDETRGDEGSE